MIAVRISDIMGIEKEKVKHMQLSKYDGKHVRINDIYGKIFTGMARYGVYEFLMHEYGGDEDGLFVEDLLIYKSTIRRSLLSRRSKCMVQSNCGLNR